MEKKGFSVNGKKIGRPPTYKTKDDKVNARRVQQRMYTKKKRAKVRDALAAAKAEAEDEVAPARMPNEINVENEEERQLHSVRIRSEAKRVNLYFMKLDILGH